MIIVLTVTAFTLLADQWSKRLIDRVGAADSLKWGPVILRRVLNRKVVYHHGRSRAALVFTWSVAATSALLLTALHPAFADLAAASGFGAALGGAAGNLVDILRRYAVVDFIDLRFWPVFNLADVAIVLGLTLALWPN